MEVFLISDFNPHAQIFAWATGLVAEGPGLLTRPSTRLKANSTGIDSSPLH
jgi:hypothetical protein